MESAVPRIADCVRLPAKIPPASPAPIPKALNKTIETTKAATAKNKDRIIILSPELFKLAKNEGPTSYPIAKINSEKKIVFTVPSIS